MKTLVVLSAALAISLACVGTASAQGLVSVTTTTDGFGNQKTFTKRRNSDGSASISASTTDAFGIRKTFTKRRNADGSESISKSTSDADGNRNSITKRRNADGTESISVTKTRRN
jgi:hypothetical protein